MSKMRVTRIQRLIERELEGTGLEHRVECGPKHRKLYIEGAMVMVFSHGANESADVNRIRSFIRRALERKNANSGRPVQGSQA